MVWSQQAKQAQEPNYLKVRGIPLGILPQWQAQSGRLVLNPGDILLLASDGITEAMVSNNVLSSVKTVDNILPASRSMLKQDGLWQILQDEAQPLSLNHLLARIQADNPVQEDDQTILSLEVL
jgi:serine phosphatase RsbU (regulator of sigma subunit)